MGFEQLFEPSRLLTFFLVVIRMSGIIFTAPIFSGSGLNAQIRMMLSIIISLLLFPTITPYVGMTDPHVLWLVLAVIKELLIGIIIGAMSSLLFTGLQLGGYLVDYQMGFSMVSVIDPVSNYSVSISGQMYNILATLIYLAIGGHHIFFRAVSESYSIMPVGDFVINTESYMYVLSTFIKVFIIAIQITAPVFLALMVVNVVMGLMARLVPQINLMIVGFPLKIMVGAFMLIISLNMFYIAFEKVMFEYFRQIQKFFELMG